MKIKPCNTLKCIILGNLYTSILKHFYKYKYYYLVIIATVICIVALIRYGNRKKYGGPWRYATVVYKFNSDLPESYVNNIIDAMNEITNVSGIKFREANSLDVSYINIVYNSTNTCSSLVGCYDSSQLMLLGDQCNSKHILIHEIIHTIGFPHEQCRLDRDMYITINKDVIMSKDLHNFNVYTNFLWDDILKNFPYDTKSIMHYNSTLFTKNGDYTILTVDNKVIGSNKALSDIDIEKLKMYYKLYKDYSF